MSQTLLPTVAPAANIVGMEALALSLAVAGFDAWVFESPTPF